MSRPTGSKNKKTLAAMSGVDQQITELNAQKLDLETAQAAIIASIAENNEKLKANKKDIKTIEKKILKLEAKKAEADAAAAAALMQEKVQKRVEELVAEGKSLDDILKKLKK